MGCTVPADGCCGSFGTLLSGPLCPVADDVTYWGGRLGALGGGGYDYEEGLTVSLASLITMTHRIMRSGVIGTMWTRRGDIIRWKTGQLYQSVWK